MAVPEGARVLVRNWPALVLGAFLTVIACAGIVVLVPPKYEATASVVLLPSPSSSKDSFGNPYLALGGNLNLTASVLARAMGAPEVATDLRTQGVRAPYVVENDPTTAGPVVKVTATSSSASDAETSLNLVVAQIPTTLDRLQLSSGAPPTSLIRTGVVARDAAPSVSRKSTIRALFAVGALGVAATVVGASMLDKFRSNRRRRTLSPDSPFFVAGPAESGEPIERGRTHTPVRSAGPPSGETAPVDTSAQTGWPRGLKRPPEPPAREPQVGAMETPPLVTPPRMTG